MNSVLGHIMAARRARSVLNRPRNAEEWSTALVAFRTSAASILDVLRTAGSAAQGYLRWLAPESARLSESLAHLASTVQPAGSFVASSIQVWSPPPEEAAELRITSSGMQYVDGNGMPIEGALSSVSGEYGFARADGAGDETAQTVAVCLQTLERIITESQDLWKLDLDYIEPPVYDGFDEFPQMDPASAQKAMCSSAAMWTAHVLGEDFLEQELTGAIAHPAAALYGGLVSMARGATVAASGLTPELMLFALLLATALREIAKHSALEENFTVQLKGQPDAFFNLAYQVQLAWSLSTRGFATGMIPPEGVGRPDVRGEKDGFVVEIEAKRCANSTGVVRNALRRATKKEYRGDLNGVFIEVLDAAQAPDAEARLRRRLRDWSDEKDGKLPFDFVCLTWLETLEPSSGSLWLMRKTVAIDAGGTRIVEGMVSELGGMAIVPVTSEPASPLP